LHLNMLKWGSLEDQIDKRTAASFLESPRRVKKIWTEDRILEEENEEEDSDAELDFAESEDFNESLSPRNQIKTSEDPSPRKATNKVSTKKLTLRQLIVTTPKNQLYTPRGHNKFQTPRSRKNSE